MGEVVEIRRDALGSDIAHLIAAGDRDGLTDLDFALICRRPDTELRILHVVVEAVFELIARCDGVHAVQTNNDGGHIVRGGQIRNIQRRGFGVDVLDHERMIGLIASLIADFQTHGLRFIERLRRACLPGLAIVEAVSHLIEAGTGVCCHDGDIDGLFLPLRRDAGDSRNNGSLIIQLGYFGVLFTDVAGLVANLEVNDAVGLYFVGAVLCPALVVPVIRFIIEAAAAVLCVENAPM